MTNTGRVWLFALLLFAAGYHAAASFNAESLGFAAFHVGCVAVTLVVAGAILHRIETV